MEEITEKIADLREIQRILDNLSIIKINLVKKGLIRHKLIKTRYKPIKNCSRQDCYKALYDINKIVGMYKWGENNEIVEDR